MSSSEQRKVWTEQDAKDAQRLLAKMDERKKRRLAGGLEGPAEITDRPESSGENADGASGKGIGTLERRPQVSVAGGAYDGFDKLGQAGSRVRFEVAKDTACPTPDEPLVADRAIALRRSR